MAESPACATKSVEYKRLDHFRTWLDWCTHWREEVPEELVDAVRAELEREPPEVEPPGAEPPEVVDAAAVKACMRRLGRHRDYEKIVPVMAALGLLRPPPELEPGVEERMCAMFLEARAALSRDHPCCGLSYGYALHQLARLVGADELASYVGTLPSEAKLAANDAKWRLICEATGWAYSPAVRPRGLG